MKYIIMAGGQYNQFTIPKHLFVIDGEKVIERTIRLLKENGIKDIAISTQNPAFDYLDVPKLKHKNPYIFEYGKTSGWWVDAFYPTKEPVCYLFGDVYFSEEAIKKIIETPTDDIELFGSMPPFAKEYPKEWIEPMALKVMNPEHLKEAVKRTKELAEQGKTWRKQPLMWDLWTVIKNVPLQTKAGEYEYNYTAINDYTSDIDDKEDIERLEKILKRLRGEIEMVKVEVTDTFTLKDYEKVEIISKKGFKPDEFTKGDILKCDDEMAKYLDGENALKKSFIKVLEVIPAKVELKEEPVYDGMPEFKKEEPKEDAKKPKKTTETKKKKIDKKVK